VTEIEVKAGVVTVSVVDPLMEPDLAVMVAVPTVTAVASPVFLVMVATEFLEEVQVAVAVRFCVVPLL
jgi:hypothetical protein